VGHGGSTISGGRAAAGKITLFLVIFVCRSDNNAANPGEQLLYTSAGEFEMKSYG
jgi:hypothetical protein